MVTYASSPSHYYRLAAWLACLVMVMNTIAPLLTQAMALTRGEQVLLLTVCTADGTQQRRIDANRLYPHIPFQRSDQACEVWQFDQPLCGQDCLQAIRLPAAPAADFTIYPQAIDPAADYRFETAETAETCDLSGQDLHRDGFPVMLPARSGVIWFYQRTHR